MDGWAEGTDDDDEDDGRSRSVLVSVSVPVSVFVSVPLFEGLLKSDYRILSLPRLFLFSIELSQTVQTSGMSSFPPSIPL